MAAKPRVPLNVVANETASIDAGGSTDDILAEIQTGQAKQVAIVAKSGKIDEQVDLSIELVHKLAETFKISDEKKRKLAQEILTAQMTQLRESLPGEMQTLAELQKVLGDELAKLGSAYENLERHNATEQQLIDAARALVTAAEGRLQLAKADLAKAESAWFFKGSRTASANEKIAGTEAEIATAKLGIAQAMEQANILRTKRILAADFSQIFAIFNHRVEETLSVLNKGEKDLTVQYAAAQEGKKLAFEHKTAAAKAMEDLQVQVNAAIETLRDKETVRDGLVVGTEDRTKVEQQISDMRKEVETLQGRLNQAISVFQPKDRATTQLEVDEQTLLGQLNVLRSLRASLKANSDAWKVTFDNRLAIMKAMAQSEASEKINDVGTAMAQHNTEFSAKALMASMRIVTEMGERHPELLEKLMDVQNIQGQGIEQYMSRMNVVLEKTRKRGGATERHSYTDDAGGGAQGDNSSPE